MSQLQKLRAKQNKVKVVFSFERTVSGIEIYVKSPKLGGLIEHFKQNYQDYNDVMALSIMRSLKFVAGEWGLKNEIINDCYINIEFLNNLSTRKTSVMLKIDNVFTNTEIKNYVELFETYLMKIKQLYNNESIPLIEVRN